MAAKSTTKKSAPKAAPERCAACQREVGDERGSGCPSDIACPVRAAEEALGVERDGALVVEGPAEPAAARKPSAKAKPSVTKAQLTKAARMRGEGATWNAIRAATGSRLGSSGWFRAWEREGIEHVAAGQRVKPKAAKPAAAKKPTPKRPAAPRTSGAAVKPDPEAVERGKAKADAAKEARRTRERAATRAAA